MPRTITIADDTHRREQAAYRGRLEGVREPEVGKQDTAVTMAVYALMREISRQSERKGRKALSRFIERAADVLEAQGYDRERALYVLRRRLGVPKPRFDALLNLPEDERNHHVIVP
jgi:hypothetical protein